MGTSREISTNVSMEPWKVYYDSIKQHCVLIVGTDDYTMNEPLMPDFLAKETVARMKHCKYYEVEGNHQTMLFGYGAQQIVSVMREL